MVNIELKLRMECNKAAFWFWRIKAGFPMKNYTNTVLYLLHSYWLLYRKYALLKEDSFWFSLKCHANIGKELPPFNGKEYSYILKMIAKNGEKKQSFTNIESE